MIASREIIFAFLLLTVALLASLVGLLTALRADWNPLRVSLAGAGFLVFAGLYAAALVAKLKGLNS